MAKFKLYDSAAAAVGEITLADSVFKAEYNEALVHEVIVAYQAANRQGTKSTKTRSEIVGGKKKPHRQKKTGRARQGSKNAPHQIGGGVAFAPKPRDFSKKVNKEARAVAFKSAVSEKARVGEMTFIKELKVKKTKTKEVAEILNSFKAEGSALIVLDTNDVSFRRAARNIPNVTTCLAKLLNVYEIVAAKQVFITEAAAKQLEEAFK